MPGPLYSGSSAHNKIESFEAVPFGAEKSPQKANNSLTPLKKMMNSLNMKVNLILFILLILFLNVCRKYVPSQK